MGRLKGLLGMILGLLLLAGPSVLLAHDDAGTVVFNGIGDAFEAVFEHNDEDPFKGWFTVTAANNGTEAWGDFHFEIFAVNQGDDISNVHFLENPSPTSSQTGLTWSVDNVAVGATIDLFFYGDPVSPGEIGEFSVYTDNPDQLSFFGVAVYPTPVPLPGAALLFVSGCGLFGWVAGKRHFGKKFRS